MTDAYPNRVGQMINTTGSSTILVLGAQLPGFPRPLSSMFSGDGQEAIVTITDGTAYQVVTVTWNAVNGTVTRGTIHEGWKDGSDYNAQPLDLSGSARLFAGNNRQALESFIEGYSFNLAEINGGSIDGTVIGGTTAAAGSFTTVNATGNITTNGVAYAGRYRTDGSDDTHLVMLSETGYQANFESSSNVLRLRLNRLANATAPRFLIENNEADLFQIDAQSGLVQSWLPFACDTISSESGSMLTLDDNTQINGTLDATGRVKFTGDLTINSDIFESSGFPFAVTADTGTGQAIAGFYADLPTAGNRGMSILAPETDSASAPFIIQTANSFQFRTDATDALLIDSSGDVEVQTNLILDSLKATSTFINIEGILSAENRLDIQGAGQLRLIDNVLTGGFLGNVLFQGLNNDSAVKNYAQILAIASNTAAGTEEGYLRFNTFTNNVGFEAFRLQDSAATFFTKIVGDSVESRTGDLFLVDDNLRVSGAIAPDALSALSIVNNEITVTKNHHVVGAGTINTINGGVEGQILTLRTGNNANDATLANNVGNLRLNHALGDFTLENVDSRIMLQHSNGRWCEISRSHNST